MSHALSRRLLSSLASASACVTLVACGASDAPATAVHTAYALPGEHVYPEGIAVDERTGDSYVGSYTTGAVYRATPNTRRAEVFLPEGANDHKTANGLEVDAAGRLWVTDSTTGVAVYDLATRALLADFTVPGPDPRFVNDLAIAPDGTAYLTDSIRAVVYSVTPDQLAAARAQGGRGELTPRFDLRSALPPIEPGAFSLNGIVVDPAGRYLLTVDMPRGDLYRIALTPQASAISEVTLRGGDLRQGDGLELRDGTLWAAHNTTNTISRWSVSDDGATAALAQQRTDEALSIPTTLARAGDRTLIVSSQFDKGGPMGPGSPQTPFAVVTLDGI
ncbi:MULTISPECIES: SMP-30/gluconolactonase/LRE family protein [Nocardia]|uniref:SMP-30/gluconolactonase/LRE family protein n=1 Tax=Nocardia TaxID=1817 RepID=UPI001357EAFB|nr:MULTISPECIES: SMP-30/gluconolactonase/LRE family protein [Nocardia]MBF6203518.1 SMP-30/gluconolactonase/LRE family protein [Streptomyces gardneri]